MGKNKSKTDEPIPKWLEGLGSETPEQRMAFRDWMQSSAWSVGEEHQEIIKRGWLSLMQGEGREVH